MTNLNKALKTEQEILDFYHAMPLLVKELNSVTDGSQGIKGQTLVNNMLNAINKCRSHQGFYIESQGYSVSISSYDDGLRISESVGKIQGNYAFGKWENQVSQTQANIATKLYEMHCNLEHYAVYVA